jgi:hypothetical protein
MDLTKPNAHKMKVIAYKNNLKCKKNLTLSIGFHYLVLFSKE